MNKTNLINEILGYQNKIGMIDLFLGKHSKADFSWGYYFDEVSKTFKVYKNGERGIASIRYSGEDEIEALTTLLNMVKEQSIMLSRIRTSR